MPRKGKSLYDWCLENGDRGKIVWEGALLANDKNLENGIDIYNISKSSHVKVNFICDKGHKFCMRLDSVTNNGSWCHICANKIRTQAGLETLLNSGKTETLLEWCIRNEERGKLVFDSFNKCQELNNSYDIYIDRITYASNQKAYFICENGHLMYMHINQITTRGSWCKECYEKNRGKIISKSKINSENNLYVKLKSMGFQGENILKGINRCKELNNDIDLTQVAPNTSFTKLLVSCDNENHPPFETSPSNLIRGRWCPYCAKKTSFPEQIIYLWCKSNFKEVYNRDKSLGVEVDVLIKDKSLAIEYNSGYYHNRRSEHDVLKKNIIISKGYNYILIEDTDNKKYTQIENNVIKHNYYKDKDCIKLVAVLCEYFESIGILIKNKNLSNEIIYKARSIMQS